MANPTRAELIALCERVLAADISPEELHTHWPDEPDDAGLLELRQTLFSGLEHLPGVRGGGPWRLDNAAWGQTPEHGEIEFFLRRLRESQ